MPPPATDLAIPSTSFAVTSSELRTPCNEIGSNDRKVSPEDVEPYPKASPRKNTNRGKYLPTYLHIYFCVYKTLFNYVFLERKKGISKIATLTPEKPEEIISNPPPPVKKLNFVPEQSESSSDSESDANDFSARDTDDSSETFSDLEGKKSDCEGR